MAAPRSGFFNARQFTLFYQIHQHIWVTHRCHKTREEIGTSKIYNLFSETELSSEGTDTHWDWETSWVEKRREPGPPDWQGSILLLNQRSCFTGWIHWLGQTERVPDPTGWWKGEKTREERAAEQLTWEDLGWIPWHGQTERVPDPTGWWKGEKTREERAAEQLTWGDLGRIYWLGQTERERVPDLTGWWRDWETSRVEKRG